jgi:3',5'-cyclic-AMP phosphodiesterase
MVRLVQFTDLHLYGDERGALRGIATLPTLRHAVAHARACAWPVDAVLLTGDLVQDDAAGYGHVRETFGTEDVPVCCLPGNHDVVSAMAHELSTPPFQVGGSLDLGPWRIILLDSSVAGSASGRLGADRLAGLDALLTGAGHALVCLHHHPLAMSSRWLDRVGLTDAEDFFRVIDAHRNVRAVLFGHVHQGFDGLRRNVRLLGTPSTCAQFLPRSDDFALDQRPPAYRTLELRPDGSLVSEIVWVPACDAGSARSACSAA